MQIEFRPLNPEIPRNALPGELVVRPREASDFDRTDLTRLALERGVAAFIRGQGPITRIIVSDDPSLDDLVAALVLETELAGHRMPTNSPWGHYVAALRGGMRPNRNLPIEDSLEGLFAMIRQEAGDPLSEPITAGKFLAGWERLAKIVRPALAEGRDPHRESLFAERPEFNREREFLRSDHTTFRRDVRRGRTWRMLLPGDPDRVAGLFLLEPESFLFKFWARTDAQAPGGAGFRFLAVRHKGRGKEWFFSTDPLERRNISTLAHALQLAEPAAPDNHMDPWYDGRRHQHAIVVAPFRGTRLSDEQVLKVAETWGKAKCKPGPLPFIWIKVIAGLCVAVAFCGVGWWFGHTNTPAAESLQIRAVMPRLSEAGTVDASTNLHVFTVGVAKYSPESKVHDLQCAANDATEVSRAFQRLQGQVFQKVLPFDVLTDSQARRDIIINRLGEFRDAVKNDPADRKLAVVYFAGHGTIQHGDYFIFLAHDYQEKKDASHVNWSEIKKGLADIQCPVLLILDTCHSGKVTQYMPRGDETKSAIKEFAKQKPGLIVLAATKSDLPSYEKTSLQHGVMTNALLEGLKGKAKPHSGRYLTLDDLRRYVSDQVQRELGERQEVVLGFTPEMRLEQIPIALCNHGE